MQKSDFSATVTSDGYMLLYKGKPIGGAGADKRDTRVRRTSARKQADVKMYNETVAREIDALVAGRGQARYLKVIEKIDGAVQSV